MSMQPVMGIIQVKLECAKCAGELKVVSNDEVNNVLQIAPCNSCIVKQANQMADDYKKLAKERIEEAIEEMP